MNSFISPMCEPLMQIDVGMTFDPYGMPLNTVHTLIQCPLPSVSIVPCPAYHPIAPTPLDGPTGYVGIDTCDDSQPPTIGARLCEPLSVIVTAIWTTIWDRSGGPSYDVVQKHVQPIASEEQCRIMRNTALKCAHKAGLRDEDAVDCEFAFVGDKLAALARRPALADKLFGDSGYLYKSALNFARNAARYVKLRANTIPIESIEDCRRDLPANVCEELEELPETHVLANAHSEWLNSAVARLSKAQRSLIARHLVEKESLAAIAAATGRSADAVRQEFHRVISRLRQILTDSDADPE